MEGPQIGLLQGDPLGGETTLQEPLATNASLGPEGRIHGVGAEPRARMERLADLLQNLENSLFDCRSCLLSVHPSGEMMNAVVPVLPRLGMGAPRDM